MPFDPSTAQLFDPESATLVEESKKKSPAEMVYEKMRPSVNESLSSLQGLGEAGLNVLSGMFGGGLGALSGAIAGIREHGLGSDEQRKKVEAEAARQAHELTFVPRTEKGQEYAEKAGKVVEQLIPVMPMMAELEGAAMATRGARSLKKEAKQAQASESLRKVGGFDPETAIPLDEAIKQADKVNAPRSEIVPDVVSEVNPARDRAMQRRQMELDLGVEQPVRFNKQGEPVREAGTRFESHSDILNVDNQGQIFKGEAPDFAYEAAKRREAEALAEPPGIPQQAELLPTINPYDVGGHVSRLREGEVTALDTPQGELFGTAVRPDEMAAPVAEAARQADFLENARQGEMFSTEAPPAEIPGVAVPGQPDFFSVTEMAKRKKEETTQAMVDSHPVVKALEAKVDTAIARLEELKAANADAAKVQKALRDVGIAKAKVDTARKNLSKPGGKTTLMYEGLGETAKRTGQAVRYGRGMANAVDKAIENWKNKSAETVVGENKRQYFKNLPGLKERLGDILPEQRPMSEIITELTQRPDIDQNMVQKGINQLSAGLSYIAQKTNNLMLKKTYERVSEAYDRAQLLNRTFIQKDLVPAMRELNLREKGEIWGRMLMAEGKETLTPQQLRVEGFSDKQIKMYEHYREAADYALKSINEARAVAGKKPIDARTGYVAGVFSGDFRRVLYSTVDGKRQVVGVVGDNTRIGLNRTIERIKENHPEWEIGEEKYMGGTGRSLGERQKAFEEALEFLAENDTNIQTLMETYKESMLSDAYNYLNQKKHTKQKKGVMGSEGMKEWETVEKNALEGMKAQIRYLETSYKWAELSKATKELEPMLSDANINMPNAKNLANKYIDRALGLSDNDFAKGISTMMDGIAKTFGVGPSVISSTARGAKNITSKQLLGYANVPFLAINAIQPITGMPAMMTFLSGRGVDASALGKASFKAADMLRDRNPTGFNKEALKFADEHGIMTSEIFDHSNNIQTGFQYYNDKVAEVGITQVEQATRASVFFTLAHALHESGLKPKDGLFEGAQRLTNMMMTDYRQIETPAIFSNFGAAGHLAANLVRYKHNQFSLMSMYAREVKNNGSYKPFGVAMATNIATAGILGMIGFQEADALYQMFSKAIGKPDTLTNVVLQNADTLSAHGIFSAATGLDLSNRLGLQDVVPNSMGEALFPGGGRLVEMAEAVPQLMGNNVDRARAARALAPNSLRGVIDRTFFEDSEGRSIDPKTLTPIVKRSTEDKVAKSVGLTGVKESDTKAKLYQQRLIDKQYAEIRKGALRTIIDDAYQGKDLNQEAVQKYLDAEGDPNTLSNAIVKFKTNQKMTEYQRRLLATSTAGSVNQARRLQRLKEAGIE